MTKKQFRPSIDLSGEWPVLHVSDSQTIGRIEFGRDQWVRMRDWKRLSAADRKAVTAFLAAKGRRLTTGTGFNARVRRLTKYVHHLVENDPVVIGEGFTSSHHVHIGSASIRHEHEIVLSVHNCDTQQEANAKVAEWLEDVVRLRTRKAGVA